VLCLSLLAAPARGEDAPPAGADGAPGVPSEVTLDEVVVRVPRAAPAAPGSAATIVEADQFAGEAKSVAELVATAPGVAVNDYGGLGQLATVSVRGASADGVRVLLDGLPLNSSAGGGVNLASIPRQWISAVEVVRGAEGARFGAGALGGAVNVVTRRPAPGAWSSQLSYGSFGTLSAAAEAGAGGDRWSGVLALGYDETQGDFPYLFDPTPAKSGDALVPRVRSNNEGRSGGLLAKANVAVGSGRLDLLGNLSAATHGLPGSPYQVTPDDRQDELRGAGVARYAVPLGGGLRVESELSLRHERIDAQLEVLHGTAQQREVAGAGQAVVAWTSTAHAGEVGVRLGGERLTGSGLGPPRERADVAAFASEEVALAGGRVRAGPAIRWERVGPFQGFSAKLGATSHLAGPLSARASAGSTFRAPSFGELYLEQGGLAPNPELRSEQALTADVALELAGAPGLARAGAFAARYTDLIVYEPDSFRRLKPFNDGRAGASGLEVELATTPWGPAALSASTAYTFLATETLRGDDAVLRKSLPHRARHRVFARLAGGRGPVELHGEAHYVSEQFQDLRNLLPIPSALTFHVGGSVVFSRRPGVSLHLDLRNLLGDRSLQDGFGNPLPGRMVMLTMRVAGGKEPAP
jgi:iron complex outermembrane receptor protein